MRDIYTSCPVSMTFEEGEVMVKVTCQIDGETFLIHSPAGDGRYLASRVHELIVGPAIAPRPLDPVRDIDA